MKLLRSVVALFKNNSSLLVVPASSFGIFLAIAARSHLPADDLYFFLSAAFSLCTVFDGGVPYKIPHGKGGKFSTTRACRTVLTNLLKASPLIGVALMILIAFSPFAKKSTVGEIIGYGCLGFLIAIVKVLTDTARVASLKTANRIWVDQLTSAFSIFRLLVVLAMAGAVPYLPVYGLALAAELFSLCRLNGIAILTVTLPTRSTWLRRIRFSASYIQANLAYNAAFNIDRLAAFYVLPPNLYHGLIGITSLYSMSMLPHKLVENELMFPSTQKTLSNLAQTVVPAVFCGAGCFGLVIALHLLGKKFSSDMLHPATYAAAALWVVITAFYNRLWSISLRDFKISFLARINIFASIIAILAAAAGRELYHFLIPTGLLAYSAVNFIGLAGGKMINRMDFATYVAAVAAGGGLALYVIHFIAV